MPLSDRPNGSDLGLRSAGGLAYLVFVAAMLSGLTGKPFWQVAAGLVLGVLFAGGVALISMVRWALRKESRVGQFSIGLLLLVTALAAGFFGAVRWLVISVDDPRAPAHRDATEAVSVCVFLAGLGLPVVLYLMEAFVWMAASLVRRPLVQRWLAERRRGSRK